MNRIRTRLTLLTTALALFALAGPAAAQSFYGSLRGIVTDQAGAAVTNAKVTMTDEGTNVSRSTVTSGTGEYVFSNVTPATYSVIVESAGFKKVERKGVVVATQAAVSIDIGLQVGDVNQSIQVTEEVPLIETATASQGTVVERQKLIDLPNLGRNPFMMSRLAPAIQQVGNPAYSRMQDQSGSSQIVINGGPSRGNNYLIDGVSITDFANRAIIIPSLEAVEEMKVQISTYDAEMGRTGGGMFNTLLKSGTNDYHGTLMGYMRETEWMGNLFFRNRSGAPRIDSPNRTYAGSFGGKLWIPKVYDGKNRTFFYLGFEGYRDTQAAAREQYTPTARERVGDFSQSLNNAGAPLTIFDPMTTAANGARQAFPGNIIPASRIDTVGRNIAATYELPNIAGWNGRFGSPNLAGGGPLPSVADQKFIKFDHNFAQWWRASLSYMRYNSDEPGENPYPSISSPDQWVLTRLVDATALNNTITPDSTTVIAIRYGFNRFPNISSQKSAGFDVASLGFASAFVNDIPSRTFPNVSMQNAYSLGTNSNSNFVHHSRNFSAQVSKYVGKHTVKVGYDYRRLNADGISFGNSSGAFSFNNRFTNLNANSGANTSGADIASLLLGAPASATGFVPTKLFNFQNYYGMYIQDDFRVSRNLTLNLGLRWERETGIQERNNNLITGFDPNAFNPISVTSGTPVMGAFYFAGVDGRPTQTSNFQQNKFSPRIGAAYQLNEKTTIRGGWGMYWAPLIPIFSPVSSEGITASTEPNASVNGVPQIVLSNPFPNGLDQPVGNTLGPLTGIGKSVTTFAPDARAGRVIQYSFDIQRQLPAGFAMTLGYSGSRTNDLTWSSAALNINQLRPEYLSLGSALQSRVPNPFFGAGGSNSIGGATIERNILLRPHPQFSAVNYANQSYGTARYDALLFTLRKNMSNGLTLYTAYTWSKNLDNSGGGTGNNLNGGNAGPQNAYDLDAEYGLAYVDSPHRWTNSLTYELPFGKGKAFLGGVNYFADLLVGGWSVNTVSTFQTGFPLQPFNNNNGNSGFGFARQRPNATGVNPKPDNQNIDQWINPAAFTSASAFTLGNVSRTISTRSPGQVNWDISVFKSFTIYERFKAQFRAEALNAMNTPLFRAPNTAVGNGAFGRVTSQANFPRMIQLGLRLFF
ncbi:MAG: TonB-dependent receptor [Bryobacter sp.]|nr:TonB-dependent receptor [Bryobacter sp.]